MGKRTKSAGDQIIPPTHCMYVYAYIYIYIYIYMLFWKNALTKNKKIGSLVKKGSRPAVLDDGQ